MRTTSRGLLPLLLLVAGCPKAVTNSAGLITVTGDTASLPAVTQLRITVGAGAGMKTSTFPTTEGAPLALPKTVSVTFAKSSSGPLTADVDGLNGGQVVAHGSGSTALASGVTQLGVTLMPTTILDAGSDDGPPDMTMPDLISPPDFLEPDLMPPPDFMSPPDMTPPALNLATGWVPTMDAASVPNPSVAVSSSSPPSVTIKSAGDPMCSCNAQTLSIPLGASFPCATTTLEFRYTTMLAGAAKTSMFIQFKNSGASAGNFSASEQPGNSACAFLFGGSNFPNPPVLSEGLNKISLGQLATPNSCTGSIDQIVIHLEATGCATTDTTATTLSNLRVY